MQPGTLEFTTPRVVRPEKLTLSLALSLPGGRHVANDWPLWVFPHLTRDETRHLGLYDPGGHLADLDAAVGLPVTLVNELRLQAWQAQPSLGPGPSDVSTPELACVVATAWRPALHDFARRGGRALLVQPGPADWVSTDGLPAHPVPFWREALRLFEPHGSWGEFPHEGWTDLLFYGLASDAAFDLAGVAETLGPEAMLTPVLTRVDARSFALHAYTLAADVGTGRMLLTTLRPQAGLGDQPQGLAWHPAGAFLLRTWLEWLTAS
jgi:hypothetical protein